MRGTGFRRAIPAQDSITPKPARPLGSGQIPNTIPLGFSPAGCNNDQLHRWDPTRGQVILGEAYAYYDKSARCGNSVCHRRRQNKGASCRVRHHRLPRVCLATLSSSDRLQARRFRAEPTALPENHRWRCRAIKHRQQGIAAFRVPRVRPRLRTDGSQGPIQRPFGLNSFGIPKPREV